MNRKTIEQVILPQQIPCTRHKIGLGYRIMQEHWVNGYATDTAFASIRYGFEKVNLHTIIGKAVK